jgi:hypothetical protein
MWCDTDSSNIGDDQPKPEDAQPKPEDADDEGPLDSDEEQELQDGESIPRAGEQDDDGGETGGWACYTIQHSYPSPQLQTRTIGASEKCTQKTQSTKATERRRERRSVSLYSPSHQRTPVSVP